MGLHSVLHVPGPQLHSCLGPSQLFANVSGVGQLRDLAVLDDGPVETLPSKRNWPGKEQKEAELRRVMAVSHLKVQRYGNIREADELYLSIDNFFFWNKGLDQAS